MTAGPPAVAAGAAPEARADPPGRSSMRGWGLAATCIFALAFATLFHAMGGEDLSVVSPAADLESVGTGSQSPRWVRLQHLDQRYVAWVVGRNAYTLLHHPSRIFDAEVCFPTPDALALGEPAITLGLIGTPAYLLTGEPVATLNFVVFAISLIAAFAMFLLVRAWTGVPAAGVVAGLLYAFHTVKIADIVHPYVYDGAWTVLALFFARRFFETTRWRDALGLAACAALQIAGSLYPLLAAAVLALPLGAWLLWHHGLTKRSGPRLLLVVAAIAVAAYLMFHPYLALRDAGTLNPREYQVFLPWSWLLPGAYLFPGWLLLALVTAAMALGRERCMGARRGDPRGALAIGVVLVLLLATGGTAGDALLAAGRETPPPLRLPNLYAGLAAFLPGLDVIRAPNAIHSGAHIGLTILAGFGAAGLLRITPAVRRTAASLVLVAFAFLSVARPPLPGIEPPVRFEPIRLRPAEVELEFFRTLEARTGAGPLLELPKQTAALAATSWAVLQSAYHHRRTSACMSSFRSPRFEEIEGLSDALPDPAAAAGLRDLGFSTIVVRHGDGNLVGKKLRNRFDRNAEKDPDAVIQPILSSETLSAYAIPPAM